MHPPQSLHDPSHSDSPHRLGAESARVGDGLPVPGFPSVTPATPLASPGPPTAHELERKCSFYRGRKQDAYDESFNKTIGGQDEMHLQSGGGIDDYHLDFNIPNGTTNERWAESEYCDSEHRHMGVCTCDHIEVTNQHKLTILHGPCLI